MRRLLICFALVAASFGCAREGSRWANAPDGISLLDMGGADGDAGQEVHVGDAPGDLGQDSQPTDSHVDQSPDLLPDISDLDTASPDTVDLLEDSLPDAQDADALPQDLVPDHETTDLVDDALDDVLDDAEDDVETDQTPEYVAPVEVELDPWGGLADLSLGEGTGFFTTTQANGRMWLVDPAGNGYFSLAIQSVTYGSLAAPALGYAPGTFSQRAAWADKQLSTSDPSAQVNAEHIDTMLQYGFNSVGGWSNGIVSAATGRIPYTLSFAFTGGVTGSQVSAPVPSVNEAGFPDVFHPGYNAACAEYASKVISDSLLNDPWNMGYYLDNELKWWGGIHFLPTSLSTLAGDFADELPETPAKQAYVQFMDTRYAGDIAALNAVYGTTFTSFTDLAAAPGLPYDSANPAHVADSDAFIETVADAYFSGATAGLKARDPNHLNLCTRFASIAPPGAIRAAARHCDVVTFNDYYLRSDPISNFALGGTPEERWAKHAQLIWEGAGGPKPVLLTEWGIRAKDTGLPNSFGAGYVVNGQADRQAFYHKVMDWLYTRENGGVNFFVGAHWFMYMDEPPTGRFDGEDSNYGIVTIRDEKYLLTLHSMREANQALLSRLLTGVSPALLPSVTKVKAQTEAQSGTVLLSWDPVPGALGYKISAMSHPAGLENRLWKSWWVPAITEVSVPLQGMGNGWVWFGVEPLHPDVASMGTRVSPAVQTIPIDPALPSAEEVLECEWLDSVTYANRYLDQGAGPGYVRGIESFDGEAGLALALEFVPSSLGWLKGPGNGQFIDIDVTLPEAFSLGSALQFLMRPHYQQTPSSQWVPSSDFVTVSLLDANQSLLATWPLSGLGATPMSPTTVTLPVDTTGEVTTIRFTVDIFQANLPLEQPVKLDIDHIEFL